MQRIPHDATKYRNNPVELVNIANRQRIGYCNAIDSYTKLLLHMDGTNNSTSFVDECGRSVSVEGNAKIVTATSKFNGACAYFDGDGDYVYVPNSSDFNPGYSDLTWDFWVKRSAINTTMYGMGQQNDTTDEQYFRFNINNTLHFRLTTPYYLATSATITDTTTWHHVAIVRHNGIVKIYIDGVADSNTADFTNANGINFISNFSVGRTGNYASDNFNGYLDEVRVSIGIARWTANFTPPTTQYVAYNNYIGA